jgi:hypothetical protein
MLNWSQARLLTTLIAAIAVVMEPMSWLTSGIPPCIVNPENYSAYYADGDKCPTFHVFLFKFLARIFETLGDPNWVVAIFTVILAISTIGLWVATISLYRAGEKQFGLARDDFNATHRPWIPVTKVTLNFGLKWAQGNALVGLNVFCKNAGNSPAQRVSLAAAIFPFLYNEDIPREMAKLQKAHAASTERALIEYTLFPGMPDELCITRMLLIPESELFVLKDRFGDPATEMVPVILGSIEYYFPFGEKSPHHTPFVYFLWGTNNGTDRLTFKLNGQNVEPDNMILVDIISAGDPT